MQKIKGVDDRVLLFASLILFSIIFYPVFWCMCPGILLFLCPIRKKIDIEPTPDVKTRIGLT